MRRFFKRIASLFRARHAENELRREIESHLRILQDDFEKTGLSPAEAKLAARRNYGNVEFVKELHRETRSYLWIENLLKDIGYAWRSLLHAPGFTAVATIALALGIGANTAIFGVVNALVLQPLAYRDADRLVTILHNGTGPVATANYIDWRDQSHVFEAMGAADYWSPNIRSDDHSDNQPSEHLYGLKVTQNMLPMLGVEPLLGRLFAKGEDREGADHEAVLSYALWQRRFGGDRAVLGKPIKLDGEAYTVVGVMPSTFKFAPFWATHTELWVPNALEATMHERGGNHLRVFARLKPDVTLARARADMATVTGRLEKEYPASNRNVVVRPLKENVVGNVETPLLMMLGAVGFVLLIACANVAHLELARTADRQREIAVRAALGASKLRLMAQFLTESLLLATLGAGAGLLLAFAGIKALVSLAPADVPRVELVAINTPVLLFLICVTGVTAVAFGLAPMMQAAGSNLSETLKEGGRGDSSGKRRNRLRGFLVASEFALAFTLLIGAGLMVRSFYALQSVKTGFNSHGVLTMIVSVAGTNEAQAGQRRIFYQALLEKLKALPGVEAAGGINHLPIAGDLWDRNLEIDGRPKPRPGEAPNAVYRIVMPGYFETMQLPIVRGRAITYGDGPRAPAVVIINEQAADRFWPGENPIGKRVQFLGGAEGSRPNWLTVVGVTANARLDDMVSPPYPEVYVAALQTPEFMGQGSGDIGVHMTYLTVVIRTHQNLVSLVPQVRHVVQSFDRALPVSQIQTMDEAVGLATAQQGFEMWLLASFGALAMILAAVGIYGVMNYAVSQRTREIGIRMPLGAGHNEILQMVMSQGMRQAIAGILTGMAAAVLLSRLMIQMLFGVQPTDPLTFVGVSAILILTALAAIAIPARKALRIEPVVASRTE
jgi:putative ABC transport system permease protein